MSFKEKLYEKLENFPTPKTEINEIRKKWVSKASGSVLEIGFGTGLNLPHYTNQVKELVGVDREQEITPLTQLRIHKFSLPLGLVKGTAEKIPFQPQSVDTIVSTWTLCCVNEIEKALQEFHRVLKQDGKIIYIEHGLAPKKIVASVQKIWSPIQQFIAGGCRVNRNIPMLFIKNGFEIEEEEESFLSGPKALTYTFRGIARKGV